jgi:hypothetical protein
MSEDPSKKSQLMNLGEDEPTKESVVKNFFTTAADPKNCATNSQGILVRSSQASHAAPTGRFNTSPRQRLGFRNSIQALKGRSKPCRNPSPACTFTSSSARKTASPFFARAFAIPCTLTWRRCSRILIALPSSSIQSKTTSTSSLSWGGPSPSVVPWRKLKRRHQNGSRPKPRNSHGSHGRPGMEHSPYRNRTSARCVNTSRASGSTIARNPSRRNTGRSWNGITSSLRKDTFGIRPPFQGLVFLWHSSQGVALGCHWAAPLGRRLGAAK